MRLRHVQVLLAKMLVMVTVKGAIRSTMEPGAVKKSNTRVFIRSGMAVNVSGRLGGCGCSGTGGGGDDTCHCQGHVARMQWRPATFRCPRFRCASVMVDQVCFAIVKVISWSRRQGAANGGG